jgi:AcrR family transcriptional regulator
MGRWQPDARGRLIDSALELYAERGFEQTTALEIAQRAGVTERTFFRYFADKREVLFDGSNQLQQLAVDAIASAPADHTPIDMVGSAMQSAASILEGNHTYARRRAAVIVSNPSLLERELLKLSTLASAVAEALRLRGVPDLTASLAAEAGVAVFKIGFQAWISGDETLELAHCIHQALGQLKDVTANA